MYILTMHFHEVEAPGTQQAELGHNDISQRGSLRVNPYHVPIRSNVNSQNPPEFGSSQLS